MIKYPYLPILAAILLSACGEKKGPEAISTEPISFQKEGELVVHGQNGDTLSEIAIEVADDDYERETGLMYRKDMESDQGMLFIFEGEAPRGFYMKNTLIPLDLIFLDSDQKVVSISRNARPEDLETIPSGVPAQYVLEIKAGLADRWNIQEGDSISFKLEP